MKDKKVMVAMSGGVDSSVAALLMVQAGYDVAGITMCIGADTGAGDEKSCCSPADIKDAKTVCLKLGIQHNVIDFSEEMESLVIRPFIDEYIAGRTPNPCIRCNEHIKFGLLLDLSIAMGFDCLATGHYARIVFECDNYYLAEAADKGKDQTYFLYAVPPEKLKNIVFPLSDYTKTEVRKIAAEKGIPVFQKPESQDICFYPSGDGAQFFYNRNIRSLPGEIVHVNGKSLGRHNGIIHYTVGQRRGLGISSPEPLYVISIDALSNRIIAGEKKYLKSAGLLAEINIFNSKELSGGRASAKIRYTTNAAQCIYSIHGNDLKVIFDQPLEAITPGQSVVLYKDFKVIGGGVIKSVLDIEGKGI